MDDSLFARLGYDPLRIHAHFFGQPAPGGIARIGGPARAEEAPGDGPEPASAVSADRPAGAEDQPTGSAAAPIPPHDGEGDHSQSGGGAPSDDPDVAMSGPPPVPLHHPAPEAQVTQSDAAGGVEGDGPPPHAGEETDAAARNEVADWIKAHWDVVKEMARAGEAPERPVPPPPPERPESDLPEEPAEPRPRPYVARGDRWNKPKMAEFLRQLAATHSVTAAARAVGMSRKSAYKLRSRLKGQPFDIAWEAAFRHGYDDLAQAALELALEGEEVPHYYQGELKATHRKRNPQLMVQLLKMRNRDGRPMLGRYGAAAEFWSERWEQMVHRVETGPVTWEDEKKALGPAKLAELGLSDEERQVDLLIQRNLPDEPRGR